MISNRHLSFALAATSTLATGCASHLNVSKGAGHTTDSLAVAAIEQRREDASVRGDIAFLESLYAPDFIFTHFGGHSETRNELLDAMRTRLQPGAAQGVRTISRTIDSLNVELHGNVALTSGRIHVVREGGKPEQREYVVRYVRVYRRYRDRWQLLTHRSVGETHILPRAP